MAQHTEVKILDDLDGSDGAKGYTFAIDGREYEIDLGDANRARLLDILDEFVKAGRRLHSSSSGRRGSAYIRPTKDTRERRALTREESAEVRAWAQANGHRVSDRGRISNDVLKAYNERDTSVPVPPRDVPYAEARSALVRDGENLVGKSKAYVAERYMQLHPNTVVVIEQKVKAAG